MISISNVVTATDHDSSSRDGEDTLDEQIASGREALAARAEPAAETYRRRDSRAIARLFTLLWHPDTDVRRTAALALPGGDLCRPYQPQYGHFAASFLRYLAQHSPQGRPDSAPARHAAVVAALRSMLEQSNSDIRAMSNMHYSFLSSALYLALLSTCRDVTESVRRLREGALHAEVCRLLGSLAHSSVVRRLNARDAEALTSCAGQALAAMPADEIPEFWRWLTHYVRARRRAVAPTLHHLSDSRAVPYLVHALVGQPLDVARSLIACLGRMGDAEALPALVHLTRSRHRALRNEALTAIEIIRRANAAHPSRTLLRPAHADEDHSLFLLRTVDANGERQDEQLLRSFMGTEAGIGDDV